MKVISVIVLSLAALIFSGCASKSELEEVRVLAEQANVTAKGAVECCHQAHDKIDRMYSKIMSK